MKTKPILFLLLSIVIGFSAGAQSLSPYVLSAAGDYSVAGGYSLSHTTGEMTMVETFTSSGSILTQGFQQPQDGFVRVPGINLPGYSLDIYPNPGAGVFYLQVTSHQTGQLEVRILDVLGQVVQFLRLPQENGTQRHSLDLTNCRSGLYIAQIVLRDASDHAIFQTAVRLNVTR